MHPVPVPGKNRGSSLLNYELTRHSAHSVTENQPADVATLLKEH